MIKVLKSLRSLIVGIIVLAWTGFMSLLAIIGSAFFAQPRFGTMMTRVWAKWTLRIAGIDLKVEGQENLPPGGAIFLFNHTSHLDIAVAHAAVPKDMRFGAKIELFKIPIFGQMLKLFGVLPIARKKREEVLQVYKNSLERVARGESFILAPEGTRQEGTELGQFKAGPFIFAIDGGIQLVPMVFVGLNQVLPKHSMFINRDQMRRPVLVKILPPVATTGYTQDSRPELQAKVRELMVQAYSVGLKQLSE